MFELLKKVLAPIGPTGLEGPVAEVIREEIKDYVDTIEVDALGNLIATALCGWAIRYGLPNLGEVAETLCAAKLTQTVGQTAIRGVFCGILMYLAVSIFRDHRSIAAILFCVPVFILSGFEHSIADMFYFAAAGIVSLKACGFLWIVILSNAAGGVLLPLLSKLTKEGKSNVN